MKHAIFLSLFPFLAIATSLTPAGHPAVNDLYRRDFSKTRYHSLPQCVAKCVKSVSIANDCKPSDATCFCTRDNITATYTACISSSCSMPADLLEGDRYQAHTCNYPYRTRQPLHRCALWGTFVVATLFFAFRVLCRMPVLEGSRYSWDDYVMVFTYGLDIVVVVATELTLANGSGLDEWRLTPRQISSYMLWTYISEILYNTIIMTTKIAVVLLYLRVWSADRITPAFRVASWMIIVILITSIIVFDLGLIFQSTPVSSTWSYIVGEKGTCINLPALTYSYGAVSISYDVIIFFLPIHSLLNLNISWQRKVGVCTVFLVGFLVTIIAIVRLQYLVRFNTKQNATWVYQTISMWSIIEINFSIVCTCMPATAGLLQRCWRWAHGQPLSRSTGYIAKQSQMNTPGTTLTASEQEEKFSPKDDVESGQDSQTELPDCETALAQGEVDGRVRRQIEGPGKVAEVIDGDPTSATEILRNRHHHAGGATALVHQTGGASRGQKIEISHEPLTKPAEAQLQYRDDWDVLHKVTVRDVPEGRFPGVGSAGCDGKRRDLVGLRGLGRVDIFISTGLSWVLQVIS